MTRRVGARQAAYMNLLLVRSREEDDIVNPPRILTGYDIMSELGLPEGPGHRPGAEALPEAQGAGDVQDREAGAGLRGEVRRSEGKSLD